MSTCIRAGIPYKRHLWQRGTCLRCGESLSKENFQHVLPNSEAAQDTAKQSQSTEKPEVKEPTDHELEQSYIALKYGLGEKA